jgi:DnaJ-class molecular chaperone
MLDFETLSRAVREADAAAARSRRVCPDCEGDGTHIVQLRREPWAPDVEIVCATCGGYGEIGR